MLKHEKASPNVFFSPNEVSLILTGRSQPDRYNHKHNGELWILFSSARYPGPKENCFKATEILGL